MPTLTLPKPGACCDRLSRWCAAVRTTTSPTPTSAAARVFVSNELHGRCRARRLAIELQSDEHLDAACAELEALVVTEPVDEHWWALLMTAQYRQGRQVRRAAHVPDGARRAGRRARSRAGSGAARAGAADPRPGSVAATRYAVGRADAQARPAPDRRIPNRLTSIIGRDDVLTDLGQELTRARLVTLLGPGGAGKTTIATELARRASTHSVTFVEFAPLTDPDSVIPAIASELGISVGDTPAAAVGLSTLDRVIDAIAGSPHLLVLDNCEHVVDAAAKAVYELLETCPDLVVLATSREALGVPGEAVWPLPPLAADAAVRLFVERAQRCGSRPGCRRARRSGRRRDLCAGRLAPAGDRIGRGTHPVDARDRVAGAAPRPVHRPRVRSAHGRSPSADAAGRRRLEPRPPRRARTRRVPTPDRIRRRSHARRRRGRVQRRRRRAARRGRRGRGAPHRQVAGAGRPLVGTCPLLDVGDACRVRGRAPPRVG